jgi:hypothetical protein
VTNHFRLDLDLVELLAGVDTNNAANHLGDNNHVAEMCLDKVGLLVGLSLGLGLAELLDQAHGAALETTVETTTGTSMDEVAELFGREVEEPERKRAVREVFFVLFQACVSSKVESVLSCWLYNLSQGMSTYWSSSTPR